jgi:hypothetical protein
MHQHSNQQLIHQRQYRESARGLARLLCVMMASPLVWAILGATTAHAETRRIAILVGNNQGAENQPTLRFAETDASKMAHLLLELGNVDEQDVLLLQGQSPANLADALRSAGRRARKWHSEPDVRVLLLFYFSGHSDGRALDLGPQQVTYEQLRVWIGQVDADVRLLIIDSCKSGSLLQSKGGTKVRPFEIQMNDDLPNLGEALITSSAANESALESEEIRGSFFTHYFVSGLRGAADTSGDGRVSLAEAYRYAFVHTESATAATLGGIQHPSYDYRLSGQGELILTSLSGPAAMLTVPGVFDRVLISNLVRDEIAVELTPRTSSKVGLQPGRYSIGAWKNGRHFLASVRLSDRDQSVLRTEDFVEVHGDLTGRTKGRGADLIERELSWDTFVALGWTRGVAQDLGSGITAVRLGMRSAKSHGFTFSMDGAIGDTTVFTEYRAAASVGYGLGVTSGRFSGFFSGSIGGGIIGQRTAAGHSAATPTGLVSPAASGAWWATRRIAIGVEVDLSLAFYERDSQLVSSLWPMVFGGVVFAL